MMLHAWTEPRTGTIHLVVYKDGQDRSCCHAKMGDKAGMEFVKQLTREIHHRTCVRRGVLRPMLSGCIGYVYVEEDENTAAVESQ